MSERKCQKKRIDDHLVVGPGRIEGKRRKFNVRQWGEGRGEGRGWFCGKDDVLCLRQE